MTWIARRALKGPLVAKGATQSGIQQYVGAGAQTTNCSFLIYHRVDGGLTLELDLDPNLFRRQMEWLAARARVIGYEDALSQLERQSHTRTSQPQTDSMGPAFVLTFDDGYVDFYTRVFPLLVEFDLPATLFVTTGFVEDCTPYPMLSNPDVAVQPVTWDMLGELMQSKLVTLGAHTHTHPVLTGLPAEQVEEELVRPLDLFEERLGFRPKHFAYPRAEANNHLSTLVSQYYASAVVGGGRPALPVNFDRYRIPRIPIRRSDGWRFFRAKLRGWLVDEEPFYERLRVLAGRVMT